MVQTARAMKRSRGKRSRSRSHDSADIPESRIDLLMQSSKPFSDLIESAWIAIDPLVREVRRRFLL